MVDPPIGDLLARRLRSLRSEGLPGRRVTQQDLAAALGVSAPLISSWEREGNPAIPPEQRLADYATFFATPESVKRKPYRLLDHTRFDDEASRRRIELLEELTELRVQVVGRAEELPGGGSWSFPDGKPIVIVCAELPADFRGEMAYADPASPDYSELYRYADLDSLFELHGHIRAVNPHSEVNFRTASALHTDDYSRHLVLLGGVDWNDVTRDLQARVRLPIQQTTRPDDDSAVGFEVTEGGRARLLCPVFGEDGTSILEDVAQFYRGPNPYNVRRTVTICNGMFGRGTYGAVRVLTDARFRDRNETYLRTRFSGIESYMIVMRVLVANGKVVTPDWTQDDIRLYEWDGDR